MTEKPNINLPHIPEVSHQSDNSAPNAAVPTPVENTLPVATESIVNGDSEIVLKDSESVTAVSPPSADIVLNTSPPALVDPSVTPSDLGGNNANGGTGRQRSRSITTTKVTRLEPIPEQVLADHDHEDDGEGIGETEDCDVSDFIIRRKERSGSVTDRYRNLSTEEEGDDSLLGEGNPFAVPISSPHKSSPRKEGTNSTSPGLARSLLSSEMAFLVPSPAVAVAYNVNNGTGTDDSPMALLSASQGGFATHSAATRRPSLTPRVDASSSSANLVLANTGNNANGNVLNGINNPNMPSTALVVNPNATLSSSYIAMATISNPVSTGNNTSQKSVSFSHTNLAIDPDNTVRACTANQPIIPNAAPPLPPILSASAASLVPPAPSMTSPVSPRSAQQQQVSGNGNISPTRMPTNYSAVPALPNGITTAPTTAATGNPPGPVSLSSSVIRGDIHMEIAKLSAKTFDKQSSQVMSASMRHHSSLSSVAMSQRLSSLRSTGLAAAGVTGAGGNVSTLSSAATSEASQQLLMMTQQEALLQQELTEKAVVVIRRVLDKLNGLDFASSWDPVTSNQQLQVADQVDRLIQEATSNENLSQSFFGWCPFW